MRTYLPRHPKVWEKEPSKHGALRKEHGRKSAAVADAILISRHEGKYRITFPHMNHYIGCCVNCNGNSALIFPSSSHDRCGPYFFALPEFERETDEFSISILGVLSEQASASNPV